MATIIPFPQAHRRPTQRRERRKDAILDELSAILASAMPANDEHDLARVTRRLEKVVKRLESLAR